MLAQMHCRSKGCAEGHAGQSFSLACAGGQGFWGSEDPRLLRDRPTDGAAKTSEIYACVRRRCMRFYAGIERRCTQVAAGAMWHVGTDALPKQGVCGGSCGSVFQTGLLWGKDSGGLKTPGY